MPEVRVRDNESIESALKRFKKKIQKAGILSEIKRRERYEKPSVKKVIDTALKYNALDKILFATDTPLGCFGEHTESGYMPQEAYNLSVDRLASFIERNYPDNCEEIKDKIFHDNAAKLFGI